MVGFLGSDNCCKVHVFKLLIEQMCFFLICFEHARKGWLMIEKKHITFHNLMCIFSARSLFIFHLDNANILINLAIGRKTIPVKLKSVYYVIGFFRS